MPKIIGILGSPIPQGNTALLLDKALEGAKAAGCEVELIDVIGLDIQSCQEIYYCKDHDTCLLNDDMISIYPKFAFMDSLILATPVMTMGIPGHLKSFIDRFQVFYMAKYFRNEPLVSPCSKRKGKVSLSVFPEWIFPVCSTEQNKRPGRFSRSSIARIMTNYSSAIWTGSKI